MPSTEAAPAKVYTAEQRAELEAKLKALDAEAAPVEEAMRPFLDKLKPLQDRRAEIETRRAELLDDFGLEDEWRCETCACLLLPGDPYHLCSDGPYLCGEHAPTWRHLDAQIREDEADPSASERDPEDVALTRKAIDAHVAAGGSLDDKCVHPFTV